MRDNMLELLLVQQQKNELRRILSCNEKTMNFGLSLTEEDAKELMECRKNTLKEQRRVEFKEGVLTKLIELFCDSQYLQQDEYVQTLTDLQEIFYLYKNESTDLLTDDELLEFMYDQFEGICYGSLTYLEETCLERFARAIRAGYRGYSGSSAKEEYSQFSEEMRWDRTVYLQVIAELFDWSEGVN